MKYRPWSTENNALAEDLTGGEGKGWGGNKKWEKKKNEREKRGSRGRRVSTGAIFLKWQCDLFIEEKEQAK